MVSSSLSNHTLPIAVHLWVEPQEPLSTPSRLSTGLTLCKPCSSNYSSCEFSISLTMSCPGDRISPNPPHLLAFSARIRCSLSVLLRTEHLISTLWTVRSVFIEHCSLQKEISLTKVGNSTNLWVYLEGSLITFPLSETTVAPYPAFRTYDLPSHELLGQVYNIRH